MHPTDKFTQKFVSRRSPHGSSQEVFRKELPGSGLKFVVCRGDRGFKFFAFIYAFDVLRKS